MRFNNVNLKGFNFRTYLEQKYNGLFDQFTPTKKQLNELKNKIKFCRDAGEQQRLTVERNKLVSKFNSVWQEWRKQQ